MTGSVFKRCGCRGDDGRQLGRKCPRLARSGHGTWSYELTLPTPPGAKRRRIRENKFRTKDEAVAALEQAKARTRRGEVVDERMTTGAWLATWLRDRTKETSSRTTGRRLRATTERSYRSAVDRLTGQLGHVELAKLRPEEIADAYDALLAEVGAAVLGKGVTTVRRIHATLSSALGAAAKARKIGWNPAAYVQLPQAERRPVRPWEPDELGAFLDHVGPDRLGPLFELMASSGLRRGEALGLRWSDVDLDAGVIVVRQQLVQLGSEVAFTRPKTSAGEDREVELESATLGTLLAHRLGQDAERAEWGAAYADHGLVFARENGAPYDPSWVTKRFGVLCESAGVRRVRLHDLRHGAASLRLAAGIPIEMVSKILGH